MNSVVNRKSDHSEEIITLRWAFASSCHQLSEGIISANKEALASQSAACLQFLQNFRQIKMLYAVYGEYLSTPTRRDYSRKQII